jgi:hypothetical protein
MTKYESNSKKCCAFHIKIFIKGSFNKLNALRQGKNGLGICLFSGFKKPGRIDASGQDIFLQLGG